MFINIKWVDVRIVSLDTNTIRAITAASVVFSSDSRNILVVNTVLVSLCIMDPFNGDFEVGE